LQVKHGSAREASAAFLTVLLPALLNSIQIAYAWNTTTSDLTGPARALIGDIRKQMAKYNGFFVPEGLGNNTYFYYFIVFLAVDFLKSCILLSPVYFPSSSPRVNGVKFRLIFLHNPYFGVFLLLSNESTIRKPREEVVGAERRIQYAHGQPAPFIRGGIIAQIVRKNAG